LEVFTGAGRRRTWSAEQKARIVAESYESGETVSVVARRHALTAQQLFGWRSAAGDRGSEREWLGLYAGDRGSGCAVRGGAGGIDGSRRTVTDDRDHDWHRYGSVCGLD
jgi:hypothetical protein